MFSIALPIVLVHMHRADLDGRQSAQQVKQVLAVNHAGLNGAVEAAKVVEGRAQLLHHGYE